MTQSLHHFCVDDLGGFYLDIIKDRQYTLKAEVRQKELSDGVVLDYGCTCSLDGADFVIYGARNLEVMERPHQFVFAVTDRATSSK